MWKLLAQKHMQTGRDNAHIKMQEVKIKEFIFIHFFFSFTFSFEQFRIQWLSPFPRELNPKLNE